MSKPAAQYTDEELDRLTHLGPGMFEDKELYARVQRRVEMKDRNVLAVGPAILAGHPSTQHLVTDEQWAALGIPKPAPVVAKGKPPKKAA